MAMAIAIAIALVLVLLTLGSKNVQAEKTCPIQRCSVKGPEISFPFSLHQEPVPLHCGLARYKLACRGNYTMLLLPSSEEVAVQSIDYSQNLITIFDQKNCIENLLLRFDPSSSPFRYIQEYYEYPYMTTQSFYTYINCTSVITSENYFWAKCLSSKNNNVYIVDSTLQLINLPGTCHFMKNIPRWYHFRMYSTYIFSFSFRSYLLFLIDTGIIRDNLMRLEWELPGCRFGCMSCRFRNSYSNDMYCADAPDEGYIFDDQNSPGGANYRRIGIGIGTGLLVFLAVIAMLCVYYFKKYSRKKENTQEIDIEMFLKEYEALRPSRYSYAQIKKITNKFEVKLGEGAYGIVFKGSLFTGLLVAVKVLKRGPSFDDKPHFMNEVATIGRIHHVNVVRLIGFCADGPRQALIFEFMPNESLEKVIISYSKHDTWLNWKKLLDITTGISRGIEYLHDGCSQRILHFDIKPHNVLLDENMIPKISDFGLAKLCSKEHSVVSTSLAKGTTGYIAPEMLSRNFGNVSHKSDVYSFGIMLLEMIGGRARKDATMEVDEKLSHVPEWICDSSVKRETIIPILSEEDEIITKKLTAVALWCIQWYPVDRPSMRFVVQMLEGTTESLEMPPNPFASYMPDSSSPIFDGSSLKVVLEDEVQLQTEE